MRNRFHKAWRISLTLLIIVIGLFLSPEGLGQNSPTMVQDSTLNNLVHPENYRSGEWGRLGNFVKSGSGKQAMILIPGLGFDSSIFQEFLTANKNKYRMYAVTIPGMGDTPAPPMPPEGSSYGENTWVNNTVDAIVKLIEREKLNRPAIVGHFVLGSMIALRLTLNLPEKIGKVVIIGGSAKIAVPQLAGIQIPLASRVAYVDTSLAPNWFKTVTEETWDSNNYYPETYSRIPDVAAKYWQMVTEVPIHVLIRYYCEYSASDHSFRFGEIKNPLLILLPDFDQETLAMPRNNYLLPNFGPNNWKGIEDNPWIEMRTMPDAHISMWEDQPEKFNAIIGDFLKNGVQDIENRLGVKKAAFIEIPKVQGIVQTPEEMAEYVGKYGTREIYIDNGALYLKGSTGRLFEMVCQAKDEYVMAIATGIKLTFIRDDDGHIRAFEINQGGQTVLAERDN